MGRCFLGWTSTGVIPRPHRKPVWNNTCVVFRRVSEVTGGPNPLTGRQRTCDSSGVAGVHGRRWSLTIRRSNDIIKKIINTKIDEQNCVVLLIGNSLGINKRDLVNGINSLLKHNLCLRGVRGWARGHPWDSLPQGRRTLSFKEGRPAGR